MLATHSIFLQSAFADAWSRTNIVLTIPHALHLSGSDASRILSTQVTLAPGRQAVMSAGITTSAALFAMAASPLMPVKAYALFAGMAVLATALLATTLFPPVRVRCGDSPGRAQTYCDPSRHALIRA